MSAEDEHLAAIAQAAAQLRNLAEYLRGERALADVAGGDTDLFDQVLAELEPIVVLAHDAEVAGAVARVLDRYGPGPWSDADLAALPGVDLSELRRIRDQIAAAGRSDPEADPPQ
ncbi:hypothetical protein [Nocardia nova]|uniref:hypothetical protein n=1 Tax=Nocardia nova TaxID=37330 RepID=UPI0025AF40DB|nr:hypothetical protein [Nocardia nova]